MEKSSVLIKLLFPVSIAIRCSGMQWHPALVCIWTAQCSKQVCGLEVKELFVVVYNRNLSQLMWVRYAYGNMCDEVIGRPTGIMFWRGNSSPHSHPFSRLFGLKHIASGKQFLYWILYSGSWIVNLWILTSHDLRCGHLEERTNLEIQTLVRWCWCHLRHHSLS